MKKFISIILVLCLLVFACGCEDLVENINSNFVSEVEHQITENSDSASSLEEQNTKSDKKDTSSTGPTICPPAPNGFTNENSDQEEVRGTETTAIKTQLPEVMFNDLDNSVRYTDMITLSNGGYAIAGVKDTYDYILSLIRIYDNNSILQGEYLFGNGNGYEKIAPCMDGGFIAASYSPPYLTKISNDFRVEWVTAYERIELEGIVEDIAELYSGCYVVLFSRTPYDDRTLKMAFLDSRGNITETIELMKSVDITDGDITPDGKGGFYLVLTCNKELTGKYELFKENYNNSKGSEIAIMHFDHAKKLTWVKTVGGSGDDWVEESAMDEKGNFYLAVGTNWYGADSFWEMGVERSMPYRRMLVKLDKNGNIVYKVPLSAKGMAVDQVFGIHIKDEKAYVVGMADYFDGYQIKYPCEQILPEEKQKGNRVFCVYNACIDGDGKELDRKIFRCDVNNMPCDSALLLNGSLVIAGKVSSDENPFNLKFPSGVNSAALFVYKE